MLLKVNKENDRNPILHSHHQKKPKFYGTSVFLINSLAQNNKILKMRRNSNFVPSYKDKKLSAEKRIAVASTFHTKKVSLHSINEKNGTRNKSAHNWQRTQHNNRDAILQQSNINTLKMQAAKLDSEFARFSDREQSIKGIQFFSTKNLNNIQNDNIKISKKPNIRKIVKGRPQIMDIVKENRNKIFKNKNSHETYKTQVKNSGYNQSSTFDGNFYSHQKYEIKKEQVYRESAYRFAEQINLVKKSLVEDNWEEYEQEYDSEIFENRQQNRASIIFINNFIDEKEKEKETEKEIKFTQDCLQKQEIHTIQ